MAWAHLRAHQIPTKKNTNKKPDYNVHKSQAAKWDGDGENAVSQQITTARVWTNESFLIHFYMTWFSLDLLLDVL